MQFRVGSVQIFYPPEMAVAEAIKYMQQVPRRNTANEKLKKIDMKLDNNNVSFAARYDKQR